MLRKNPKKIINFAYFSPKPLYHQFYRSFSENDNKDPKKSKKFSIGNYIGKINTYMEEKENSAIKFLSGLNSQKNPITNSKLLFLGAILAIMGYNLYYKLNESREISYTVKYIEINIKFIDILGIV